MGWLYTHRDKNEPILDFFQKRFCYEDRQPRILDMAIVKMRTAYMAFKTKDDRVIALVVLLDHRPRDYYNFGYKDMDEFCGPCESECPERILKLLSPLPDDDDDNTKWAGAWRQRCWKRVNKRKNIPKLKEGDVIKFVHPIRFTDNTTLDTFKVILDHHKVKLLYGCCYYRISNWRDREFEVIKNG